GDLMVAQSEVLKKLFPHLKPAGTGLPYAVRGMLPLWNAKTVDSLSWPNSDKRWLFTDAYLIRVEERDRKPIAHEWLVKPHAAGIAEVLLRHFQWTPSELLRYIGANSQSKENHYTALLNLGPFWEAEIQKLKA